MSELHSLKIWELMPLTNPHERALSFFHGEAIEHVFAIHDKLGFPNNLNYQGTEYSIYSEENILASSMAKALAP